MELGKILALTDVSICCIEMIFMFVCLCGCSNAKDVILSTAWGQWKYSTSVASVDVSAQIGVNLMGYALKGSISGLGSESTSGTWVDAYKNDDPTSDYDYCSSYDGTYTYGGDPSDSIDAYAARPKEAAVPTRARAPRPPRARCAQRALPPPLLPRPRQRVRVRHEGRVACPRRPAREERAVVWRGGGRSLSRRTWAR